MRRALAGSFAAVMLLAGCGKGRPTEECLEALSKRQAWAADRAAQELDRIGDSIEGALDIQKKGGLDPGQERLLRKAQGRARAAQEDLEGAFSVGCE